MAEFCACNGALGNTGRKKDLIKQSRGLFFVRLFDDDGTRNEIAVGDTVDDAYVVAKINQSDPSKRWYPIQDLKNVEDVRAESVFQTFNDGVDTKVRQGNRTFTGFAIQQGSIFFGKLKSYECEKMGVYFVDDCHDLVGSISSDGTKLRPVAISDGSLDITLVKATDAATGMVGIRFGVSALETDASLRVLGGLDFSGYEGLLDVNCAIGSITVSSFVATLTLDYGKFQDALPARGAALGEFSLFNATDNASVTISAVNESPAGTYTFTIPGQTSGDDLILSLDKEGFEMAETAFAVP